MNEASISLLKRLPLYLRVLSNYLDNGNEYISSIDIASSLSLNEEQVKKDLQIVSNEKGQPKLGRDIKALIKDINSFLGYDTSVDAILIGVGNLGKALLNYKGFNELGVNILAGFDINENIIGSEINGKKIYSLDKLNEVIKNYYVNIAIITTPGSEGEKVAKLLVDNGIKAIWNFSPCTITVNNDVIVENVNLASSLAVLTHKLKNKKEEN